MAGSRELQMRGQPAPRRARARWLSAYEAAVEWGLTKRSIWRWIHQGVIPPDAVRRLPDGTVQINASAVPPDRIDRSTELKAKRGQPLRPDPLPRADENVATLKRLLSDREREIRRLQAELHRAQPRKPQSD